MSPAGEGPTVPAVSLGSLGARRVPLALVWEGLCHAHAEFFVLAWGRPGRCEHEGGGIPAVDAMILGAGGSRGVGVMVCGVWRSSVCAFVGNHGVFVQNTSGYGL